MTIIRFCSDCSHESTETAWSTQLRMRLCPKCQQEREAEDAADWTYQDTNGEVVR